MINTITTQPHSLSGIFIMIKLAIASIIVVSFAALLLFTFSERNTDPEDGTYEHQAMKARGAL